VKPLSTMVWPFSTSARSSNNKSVITDDNDHVEYEYETDSQGSVEIEEYVEDDDDNDNDDDDDDDDVEYEIGGDLEVSYATSDEEDEASIDDKQDLDATLPPVERSSHSSGSISTSDAIGQGHAVPAVVLSFDDSAQYNGNNNSKAKDNGDEAMSKQPASEAPKVEPEATSRRTTTATTTTQSQGELGPLDSAVSTITTTADTEAPTPPIATEETSSEETTLQEKQSLLALAAEHDRVDILKGILSEHNDRETLLHTGIPPLHVAISFGSTNATSCLLRMGANPSIRPNIQELGLDKAWSKFDGVTAWELAFGRESNTKQHVTSSWFGTAAAGTFKPLDMAPSKREGIRHAFTAEALRSIGADEQDRLEQLLDSGMPADIDIGGRTLHGWCIEMGATNCQRLIGGEEQQVPEPLTPTKRQLSFHGDDDDVTRLTNRLEEVESLASALSICLDNIAEEVSVCHGLLLLGGGGSALASHVRSLKELLKKRHEELLSYDERCRRAEDDVEILAEKCGADHSLFSTTQLFVPQNSRRFPTDPVQLQAQIGASENKVFKLRASIADMSEENATAIKEVEKKGLLGGLKLVRGLREELREIEFQLSTAKSEEGVCRAKIQILQAKLDASKTKSLVMKDDATVSLDLDTTKTSPLMEENSSEPSEPDQPKSSAIANGKSEALMLHQKTGYMPLNIWLILLRIIGLGRVAVRANVAQLKDTAASNVMII